MNERTHVDLFAGIGGFSLAASWNGVRTVAQCELDPKCRAFLEEAWPDTEKHNDVRTFDGERYAGAWLLTAGVPCQPASRAGKQRGSTDDRWLWPAALAVLGRVRPTWALFENPPGIGDVGLTGILADVEALGYEVRVFGIPACAVGSPQRRERYWIVCHMGEPDSDGRAAGQCQAEAARYRSAAESNVGGFWRDYVWLPCADGKVRRAPDDSVGLVDGLHKSVLAALGNSIVPQVAAEIINAMIEAETASFAGQKKAEGET